MLKGVSNFFTWDRPFWDLGLKPQSFSNYPYLKVLEAHIGENMQNTSKIKDWTNANANISATKFWIFKKLYVVVNHYLVSLSWKFHEDWCTNERAWVVTCMRMFYRKCAHLQRVRALFWTDSHIIWNLSSKIYSDHIY